MKKSLIMLCAILCLPIYSQRSKNSYVGVHFTFGENAYFTFSEMEGSPGYNGKSYFSIGVDFKSGIAKNLEIETGLNWSEHRLEKQASIMPDIDGDPIPFEIRLISIPIIIKYRFFRYLFINGGAILNMETTSYNQSGLGFRAGLGAGYTFKSGLGFSVNPYYQMNAMFPYEDYKLVHSGWKIGVGYTF